MSGKLVCKSQCLVNDLVINQFSGRSDSCAAALPAIDMLCEMTLPIIFRLLLPETVHKSIVFNFRGQYALLRLFPSGASESAASSECFVQALHLLQLAIYVRLYDDLCDPLIRRNDLYFLRVVVQWDNDMPAIVGIDHAHTVRKSQTAFCGDS